MPTPPKHSQFKPGQSGNPKGKVKGTKNWSTITRQLLEDPNFEVTLENGKKSKYPAKVITEVMIRKAAQGDVQAYRELRKTGYGDMVDLTSGGETISFVNEVPRAD